MVQVPDVWAGDKQGALLVRRLRDSIVLRELLPREVRDERGGLTLSLMFIPGMDPQGLGSRARGDL